MNWHGFIFDELINGQAVIHYSELRLTASVAYAIRSRTRQIMPNGSTIAQFIKN